MAAAVAAAVAASVIGVVRREYRTHVTVAFDSCAMKLVLLDASALETVCMMIGRGMNVIDRGFCSVIARVVLANGPARRATSATLGKHARDLREKHATFADTDAAPKHSTSLRALSKARMDALFGKKTDFKDQVRSWKSDMRSEGRKCDKQIRGTCARRRPRSPLLPFPPPFPRPLADAFAPLPARSIFSLPFLPSSHLLSRSEIEREQKKIEKSIKEAAKRGDTGTAKMLAKEIVRSRKAVNRLHNTKAQMNSVTMQMENQMAQQKVTGHLQKSAEVMKMMNKLTKTEQVRDSMQKMQEEMMKAGLLEEMVDDAMGALDGDDDEEAADEEVMKVFQEFALDATKDMKSAGTKAVAKQEVAAEEDDDEDMAALRSKLEGLKG